MVATGTRTWPELNREHLAAQLARLRERLLSSEPPSIDGSMAGPAVPDRGEDGASPALESLARAFGLSAFERDLLLLAAGPDLDGAFARCVAEATGDPRGAPTLGLALARLDGAHWSALAPSAPLRRWRFIESGEGASLTRVGIRADVRVVQYLAGVNCMDERLQPLLRIVRAPEAIVPSQAEAARSLARAWSTSARGGGPVVGQLVATASSAALAVAATAAEARGLVLAVLDANAVPAGAAERHEIQRLLEREAVLGSLAIALDCFDLDTTQRTPTERLLEALSCAVVALSRTPLATGDRDDVILQLRPATASERRDVWQGALRRRGLPEPDDLTRIADTFALDPADIEASVVELDLQTEPGAPTLWDICRRRARPRIEHLAQRVESTARWPQLVLPEAQLQVLRDLCVQVRRRSRVYGEWGFGADGARGLSIAALFSGASGTGKTMAAEVMAGELALDLYRIDLSQVVSKYIGETEKNLARVFDGAGSSAVLLFDEADALFGKRTEVTDSHDRYANIEVSYLLQRIEAYEGLAILTTNLRSAVDAAFLRRIRFAVQFPFPDAAARAAIWRGVFPAATPTEGLDVERLAQLNVAGGTIRNIAVHAAFVAADRGEPVRMAHLLRAARAEYLKLERSLSETEIRGWG